MKYRLLEFLKEPETDEGFTVDVYSSRQLQRDIDIDRVQCSTWCHKEDKQTNQIRVTDCRNCYNLEITEGKLTAGAAEYPSLRDEDLLEGDLHFNIDYRGIYGSIVENWLGLDPVPVVGGNFEQLNFVK